MLELTNDVVEPKRHKGLCYLLHCRQYHCVDGRNGRQQQGSCKTGISEPFGSPGQNTSYHQDIVAGTRPKLEDVLATIDRD